MNLITPDESSGRVGESGIGTIEGIVVRVKRTNECSILPKYIDRCRTTGVQRGDKGMKLTCWFG